MSIQKTLNVLAGCGFAAIIGVGSVLYDSLQTQNLIIKKLDQKIESIEKDTSDMSKKLDAMIKVPIKSLKPQETSKTDVEGLEFNGITTKDQVNVYFENRGKLPRGLLSNIHFKETSGDCNAVSHVGAIGCFQFMLPTKGYVEEKFGYTFDAYSYIESAEAATDYLNYLYNRIDKRYHSFNSNVKWGLTLAAYNGGLSNAFWWAKSAQEADVKTINELLSYITFKETRQYVKDISFNVFGVSHTIVKGDTLYKISKVYDVKIDKLLADNGSDRLIVGNIIKIK